MSERQIQHKRTRHRPSSWGEVGGWESEEGEEERPHGEPCLGLWGQVWELRLEVEAAAGESRLSWDWAAARPHGAS